MEDLLKLLMDVNGCGSCQVVLNVINIQMNSVVGRSNILEAKIRRDDVEGTTESMISGHNPEILSTFDLLPIELTRQEVVLTVR